MMESKKKIFDQLILYWYITDNFLANNIVKYTLDNKHRDKVYIFMCFNQLYSFQSINVKAQLIIEYFIISDCNHFDHLFV